MSGFLDNTKKILLDRSDSKSPTVMTYVVCGLISCALALVLTFVFNVLGLTQAQSFREASDSLMGVSDNALLLVLLYCIVTPLFEEIIFRFIIFAVIFSLSKNAVISVVVTALLFGLYHLNPVQMLYGFIMGLLITYYYYRYRRLSLAFMMHALANLVGLAVTFF